jgi:rare lipoprotein A (peptidoglycan hydrolase)
MSLQTNAKKAAAPLITCVLALSVTGVTVANAQGGGTVAPAPTQPPAAPAPTTGTTIYKKATWYGPGFWGNETACGMTLQPKVVGVAHKKLPCGTQVTFEHDGVTALATVIDRGPYHKGYTWDLTKRTAKILGFLDEGSGPINATVAPPAP